MWDDIFDLLGPERGLLLVFLVLLVAGIGLIGRFPTMSVAYKTFRFLLVAAVVISFAIVSWRLIPK